MRATVIAGVLVLFAADDARAGPLRRLFAPAQPAYVVQPVPVYDQAVPVPAASPVLPAPAVGPTEPAFLYPATYQAGGPAYSQPDVPYPILAAFALATRPSWAPGAPPPLGSGQPLYAGLPRIVSWTLTVFTYLGVPYSPIGIAVPRAIRTAHVLLNGTPYPGRPVQTVYWIAFPLAAQFTDRVRERGGLFGRRGRGGWAAGPDCCEPAIVPAVYYSYP